MTILNFKREEYQDVCEEMKALLQAEKEMAVRKDELRKRLLDLSGGERMEYGIKVTQRSAIGSVDYKRIVEDHLDIDDAVRDHYRKPAKSYWEVRSY